MPQKDNFSKLDLGDWHDFFANGLGAIILGAIIGTLFGWQFEKAGIFWGCVIWIPVFAIIGFRKQIKCFFYSIFLEIQSYRRKEKCL